MKQGVNKEIAIKDAKSLYHSKMGNNLGTLYLDPFTLPEYFHPTYEMSGKGVRFNNKAKIAGFEIKDFSCLEELYDLMRPDDRNRNVSLAYQTLRFRNYHQNTPDQLLQYLVEACFSVKGRNGKTYNYLRRGNENGRACNRLTHTMTNWVDLGDSLPKDRQFWRLTAKNSEFFDFDLPEISQYQGMLSAREVQILRLLARGFSSRDIGKMLSITKNTVDTHRRNMLRKMEVANTPELLDMARDMNLLI